MKHPILRRVNAARRFPENTCPASRHAQQIAEHIFKQQPYPMLQEEPEHCGESLLCTVAALYETRSALAELLEVCLAMDAEIEGRRPTERRYQAAVKQAAKRLGR